MQFFYGAFSKNELLAVFSEKELKKAAIDFKESVSYVQERVGKGVKVDTIEVVQVKRAKRAGTLKEADFDGSSYNPVFDFERLSKQAKIVFSLLKKGQWITLEEISKKTGFGTASISARFRDFRKEKFGGLTVQKRRSPFSRNHYQYRLLVND